MEEKIVSFKTAKLANKKGFYIDTPTFLQYDERDEYEEVLSFPKYRNNGCSTCRLPTQSLLQKWLREEHQIFVTIGVDGTMEPKFCYDLYKFNGNPRDLGGEEWWWDEDIEYTFYLYRTYEDALEEGLETALNLIKTKE
jgi:hypothetical protein